MEVWMAALAAFTIVLLIGLAIMLLMQLSTPKPFLDKTRKRAEILDVTELSPDVKRYRLSLGGKKVPLGLPLGKHVRLFAPNAPSCLETKAWNGKADADNGTAEIQRAYTPTPPTLATGFVDLVIKVYRPGTFKMPDGKEVKWEDGGKMSRYLDSKKVGDFIDIFGPVGTNEYLGRGTFKKPGSTLTASHYGMLAGGTGITPMLQLVYAALRDPEDSTKFTLIYANKTEEDILCRDMLEAEAQRSNGRFKLHYTLDFPPANWTHKQGFITADMLKECFPSPETEPIILMCGPPPMIEFACKKNLDALGYPKNRMVAF
jgi:cytochrome-b5 reductase